SAPRLVDGFESVDGWTARPADGVELSLASDAGVHGRALRADFRFVKGGGYAVLHRDLALDLPENYRFTFELRGECRPNNLEFKLVDSSGANVWWLNQRNVQFPRAWQAMRIKKRQIQFAWGPSGGGEIRHVAAIEIAVTAGEGGSGSIWLDDLELTALPPAAATPPPLRLRASSERPGHGAARAADGDTASFWQSAAGDRLPRLTLDLQEEREFGGLVIDWGPRGHPGDYLVEASDDGASWRALREVRGGRRPRDPLFLPESESRFVRVRTTKPLASGRSVAVREITLEPLEWSATRAAFFQALAQEAPRGSYPRGITGEASAWTVVSVDGGTRKGLLGLDGAIDTGPGAFSVEPFLSVDGRLVTWADVTADPTLANGVLPVPSVVWRGNEIWLGISAIAFGPADSSSILATYVVTNPTERARQVTLYLALRPFQVNPPVQFLNTPGGTGPIRTLAADGPRVRVNGDRVVESLTPPSGFGAEAFDQGDIVDALRAGRLPAAREVRDPFEAASGAFAYALNLGPRSSREVDLILPLHAGPPAALPADSLAERRFADFVRDTCRLGWQRRTAGLTLQLPGSVYEMGVPTTLTAQLGWILATREGAALHPGPRAYARAWIRDGALISSALLRLGKPAPVRAFIEWFAPYQYDDGKVPCCVDARGADPVPEHDSGGEFIYLVAEYYRYTGDRALVERMWPRVRAAAAYLDSLRRLRRTPEWRAPEQAPFFGLLPPSISHEGYSAKPMHSYWDDFFALRGFKDAATLAGVLGLTGEAARLGAVRDTFARDLGASVAAAMAAHHVDYVPGSADLGDFDATSTAIALAPAQAEGLLPRGALERTFDRYWTSFTDRRDGRASWDAFTPYEMRSMGAFVRLGERARALAMLRYFLGRCLPPGWLQWPEVVWRDARAPKFLGDLPHTWVGAEYVRALLDFFAYDRESDRSLVVGAGIPMAWVEEPPGLAVHGLRTPYGPLDLEMESELGVVEVRIGGGLTVPPGGIAVRAPFDGPVRHATVEGVATAPNAAGEIVVHTLPVRMVLRP
ncbi:MAG TPA: discoidin domain-containing protein, partial [Candidatus Eisenbacteria bacterium]